MASAFVAGATGYTGRSVVAELRGRGVAVTAHVRPDSSRLAQWRARFESLGAAVDTSAWRPDALTAALDMHRPTVVFALLGTTRRRARIAAEAGVDASYEAVDRDLTLMLLEATRVAAPKARFVYLSSLGADADASSAYLRARGAVEAALRTSEVAHIIARPSFVTGADRDERRPAERGAAIIADAVLGVAARLGGRRLRDRYASLTGDELARALGTLALGPAQRRGVHETAALRRAAGL